jgi:hypothetical protein
MAAIIDSRESEKIFVAGARQFIAGRASIMTALTASCLLVSTARAGDFAALEKKSDETTSSSSVPEGADAVPNTGLDATVLNSRVALTNEFKDQEFGAAKDTATLNLAYAFGNTARPDWTVQVDLPVVHYDAGNIKGVESGSGIGDIEFRIGHVIHSEGLFRYAAGVEAEFDTAGGPPLGDGIFRLSPIVAFAVQPCSTFKFQTFVQFNQSLITETGVSEEQEIHLKPAVNFSLPAACYFYTECEEVWALQAHGQFSSTLKFEIGRGFGARGEWALSARCEIPLTTSSDDYTVTVGCTYVFK